MPEKRDIDYVVDDPTFELRRAHLTLILEGAIAAARMRTRSQRTAELSGSAVFALGLALVSVEKFKTFGAITSEQIQGALAAFTVLALLVLLFAIIRLARQAPTPSSHETITTLLGPTDASDDVHLAYGQEAKGPLKRPTANDGIDDVLEFLMTRQGVSPRNEIVAHLESFPTLNNPTAALEAAMASGLVRELGNVIGISKEGVDRILSSLDAEARQTFYGEKSG